VLAALSALVLTNALNAQPDSPSRMARPASNAQTNAKLATLMPNAPSAPPTSGSTLIRNALPAVLDVMVAAPLMVFALNAFQELSWMLPTRNHASHAVIAAKNALMPPNARPALTPPSSKMVFARTSLLALSVKL